jgi:hypothetical protein
MQGMGRIWGRREYYVEFGGKTCREKTTQKNQYSINRMTQILFTVCALTESARLLYIC